MGNAEIYLILRPVHIACALVTISLFVYRGWWIVCHPGATRPRWMRIVPHGIDTLLLASAIGLVYATGQYPGEQAWLNAKIVALVVYIVLGLIAFRFAPSPGVRSLSWVLGIAVVCYIALVAVTRSPVPV